MHQNNSPVIRYPCNKKIVHSWQMFLSCGKLNILLRKGNFVLRSSRIKLDIALAVFCTVLGIQLAFSFYTF